MDWTRGRVIGRGSSAATVSIAAATTSQHSGGIFAVKSAELSQSKALQREQAILSQLNHPNIIRYIGCDTTVERGGGATFNLLMEFASQGTVIESIARRPRAHFDEPLVRRYTRQIVKGLEYLHSRNVVHGDVKGSNVLVSSRGEVKIADFGCAKAVEEAMVGGTPMFMAREVLVGGEQGFEADVWALGCTVIEMCAGKPPSWPGGGFLKRVVESGEVPEFPSLLSDSGKDFLDKCLRVDPEERWSAKELLRHPFVEESGVSDRVKESSCSCNNSPTSVLDQGFWCSAEEDDDEIDERRCSSTERIKDLAEVSRDVSWESEEFGWVTVRESENDGFRCNIREICRKKNLKFAVCNDHGDEFVINEFR